MTKTYTQSISGGNLSHENICGIIIIQLQLKKWGETLCVATKCLPSYGKGEIQMDTVMDRQFCHSKINSRDRQMLNKTWSIQLLSFISSTKSQRRVAKYEPTSLKEAGELLAKSSGSGASLALALKFERWALVAMREGDASLTKQLLRAAIIHHPDPNAYIQRLQNTQIPELGPNKATEL